MNVTKLTKNQQICTCGIINYTEDDICLNKAGEKFIVCPECRDEILIVPTINNISFPQHFSKVSGTTASDALINNWIDSGIEEIRDLEAGNFHYCSSGNTMMVIFKFEDEYQVIVTKDYMETSIPRMM